MKKQISYWCCLFAGITFFSGCSNSQPKTVFELLPPRPLAHVSFRGITQAGDKEHSLEVRTLAFYDFKEKRMMPTFYQYIVYNAGSYGPEILKKVDGAGFLVKKESTNIIEIYYTAGAHTDMRQRWRLTGDTAELQEEKEIEWDQRPKE